MKVAKVVIYARTSSDKAEGESVKIPVQVGMCQERCQQKGYDILETITDSNISGSWYPPRWRKYAMDEEDMLLAHFKGHKKLKWRKGFDRLLDLLPYVDAVVCIDRTRIDRALPDSFLGVLVRKEFTKRNVIIEPLQSSLVDFKDRNGTLVDTISSTISRNAKLDEYAKASVAKRKHVNEGYSGGSTNLYAYESDGKNKVRIVKSEAAVVKKIFRWADQGVAFSEIAKRLNASKAPLRGKDRTKPFGGGRPKTPGRQLWNSKKIVVMVDRVQYCGRTRNTDGDTINSKIYPPLVSFQLWERVHSRRLTNACGTGWRSTLRANAAIS